MNETIAFVILHYNAINETIDCVNSIISNVDKGSYSIIIVDNNSPNGTGKRLERLYAEKNDITVILNKENLGFACGNNVGYKYVCEELKSDFICILNNDTLLMKNDFFDVVKREYEKSKFGIMGPKIVLKDGSVNCLYYKLPGVSFFINQLRIQKRVLRQMKWRLNYVVVPLKLFRNFVLGIFGKRITGRFEAYQLFGETDIRREDIILHGCCIVFSREYFSEYKDAFNPDTFLYKEEELLYLRCKNKKLSIVYNPELVIKHLEDVATDTMARKKRERIMFQLENQIKSLKILIEVMASGEE